MRKIRRFLLMGLILCSFTACGNGNKKDETELGSVTINQTNDDRFGTFTYSYSIDKDGASYTIDTNESFTVKDDDGSIVIDMTDESTDKTVEVSLISAGEKDLYQATMSNDGAFEFDSESLEWIITKDGESHHYQKTVKETVSRSEAGDSDVSFGAEYINIPDELISEVVTKAEEEGVNYYYTDADTGISVVLLPIPNAEGEFKGTHALVWLIDEDKPGDVATLYFDGSYGAREASVIGSRRDYQESVVILENSIDDFKKDTNHNVTEDDVRTIMQGYVQESEEGNE